MASATVTRRALTLGDRDATTNWPSKSYAETTIKGSFDPATARQVFIEKGIPLNQLPYLSSPFYTANLVVRGDRIEHAVLGEYELVNVVPIVWLNQFVMYACQAEKVLAPADRAATSGTWHVDLEAIKTDPRNRIIEWLKAHISYGVCDYEIIFAGGDYPFEREFTELGNEIICTIDIEQSTPEYTADLGDGRKPYKFNETCTITNTAIDTATLTATNILESFEQAIRDVATDHPLGSIRRIRSSKPERINIGGAWLWTNTITIEYTRANDDYVPNYPTVTWGPSAAPSGTWKFPNCSEVLPRGPNKDAWIDIPGFYGTLSQGLAPKSLDVEFIIDLDVCTTARPFKRAGWDDATDYDIAIDIWHNSGSQAYQTLTWKSGGPSYQVRLCDDWYVDGDNRLHLHFREYRTTSASAQTYKQRLGIS